MKHHFQNLSRISGDGWHCPSILAVLTGGGSFPPSRTFWLFLSQVLSADQSCEEAVKKFLAWLAMIDEPEASPNTAAYCKARIRLPEQDIRSVGAETTTTIQKCFEEQNLWFGRNVKIIDGSSLSMPDTPENQKAYPQPEGQKPGCGFPVMRIVAIFSLATGVILDMEKGNLQVHERTLFRRLWDRLQPGDIALTDAGFTGYADIYELREHGVDSVTRNIKRRKAGISVLKNLSPGDRIIQWHKSSTRPLWMDEQQWREMPDRITLREIFISVSIPGFRTKSLTIVTTLLDATLYPKDAFETLYRRRWLAELFLRYIKTIMRMDVLRCKTPSMVHKELEMYIVAYNLIRALISEAASLHALSIYQISFKGAVSVVRKWAPLMAAASLSHYERTKIMKRLLNCIAYDKIPHRPNRTEPRAIKRRPKSYQLLTKPRHIFKEIPHRKRYRLR